MALVELKRVSPLLRMLLVVVRNMTAITVHEVAVLIVIILSRDARIIEEEEGEVDIAEIAVMTCVQGEIMRIAPVDAMMTAARMVARDVVVLTALQRLM
jgi:hypothetical protein